jgi:uncharacterized membrane protein
MKKIIMHVGRRKRIYIEIALALVVVLGFWLFYVYQEANFETYLAEKFPSQGLSLGQVVSVQTVSTGTAPSAEVVTVQFLMGNSKGQTTKITEQAITTSTENSYLHPSLGDKVLLAKNALDGLAGEQYYITDSYRLPSLLFIILLFVIIAIIFGRVRGLTSIIGLAMSVAILLWFVVPNILAGNNPLLICLIGAALIAISSLYLAHGFNKRTTIALCGTLITLSVTALLSIIFISMTKLLGIATDTSFYVEIGKNIHLDLKGLLLGGIIIGALGILDDVTIGQAATVYELKDANPSLTIKELYRRGMSIGREHIASLINTLFLAYAGVTLPLILYLAAFQSQIPLWLTINGEPIAEEIVRTMVGSIGIILAVPITTLLAAWMFGKQQKTE